MSIKVSQQRIIDSSHNLLNLLSRIDNLKMFSSAYDGLKINTPTLRRLDIPRKRYYRALKQLKDAGLIEKDKKGYYVHTTFGSIVYQRIILDMEHYTKYLEKMQMIDTIRRAERFSEAAILKLTEEIMDSALKASSFTYGISQSINNIDIILSFDKVIQTLLERIECCKSEILISTRLCSEIVINKIVKKSKLGVKVKVLVDIDLIKEYFSLQEKFVDNLDQKNPMKERKCVVANPWYPDNTINRRLADIPFGMIILDNTEVGLELVDSNNPNELYGGIFIRDKKFAMTMTEFYQQIWEEASENVDLVK